jgi:hypothetical protein
MTDDGPPLFDPSRILRDDEVIPALTIGRCGLGWGKARLIPAFRLRKMPFRGLVGDAGALAGPFSIVNVLLATL